MFSAVSLESTLFSELELPKTQIFITGATGYIGGSVTDRLLRHPTSANSEITVLVRNADKASVFESLGVRAVLGSYDDHALLEKQAYLSDIIFACADADNADACAAMLRGSKKKYEETCKWSTLIHTSGTGIIANDTKGDRGGHVWDDTDVGELESIPDTQPHRNVDMLIHAADKAGYVRSYFIIPSTIYGFASGKLADLGIQNTRSIQLPLAVAASVSRRRAGHVGKGLNVWPNVHIDDVADLYIVLYDAILDGRVPGHGFLGYYFVENGHHSFLEVSSEIGKVLYEWGGSETPKPNAFTEEDYKKFPALPFLGTDCKCDAKRGRAIGWKPKYTKEDMLKSLRGEVDLELRHVRND